MLIKMNVKPKGKNPQEIKAWMKAFVEQDSEDTDIHPDIFITHFLSIIKVCHDISLIIYNSIDAIQISNDLWQFSVFTQKQNYPRASLLKDLCTAERITSLVKM
jgi:hypothetical protein